MLIFGQVLIPYFESRLVSVWVGNWSFRSFCYKKNWIGLSGLSARRRIGSRSSHRRCSIKKRFLKIQQYSQGRLCWCFILIKLQVLQHSCFPVKIFKNTYFKKHNCERLLLWTQNNFFSSPSPQPPPPSPKKRKEKENTKKTSRKISRMKQSISKIFYRNIEYSYKERWSKSATVDWLWVGVLSHTQTFRNLPGGWLLFGRSGGGIAASKIIKKYFRMTD